MRFKTDENLPDEAADLLNEAHHDAVTVVTQRLGGKPDPIVINICKSEGRALLTLDLDFGDIRAYPPVDCYGIIVLRPAIHSKSRVLSLVQSVIQRLKNEDVTGKLWIVDEAGVRVRQIN